MDFEWVLEDLCKRYLLCGLLTYYYPLLAPALIVVERP